MNREQTKERLLERGEQEEVERHFAEGGDVEDDQFLGGWRANPSPQWYWGDILYRKAVKPTYRPHRTIEDIDAAIKQHGLVIVNKETNRRVVITAWEKPHVYLAGDSDLTGFVRMLDNYTWHDDGSPCGVEVNDE